MASESTVSRSLLTDEFVLTWIIFSVHQFHQCRCLRRTQWVNTLPRCRAWLGMRIPHYHQEFIHQSHPAWGRNINFSRFECKLMNSFQSIDSTATRHRSSTAWNVWKFRRWQQIRQEAKLVCPAADARHQRQLLELTSGSSSAASPQLFSPSTSATGWLNSAAITNLNLM